MFYVELSTKRNCKCTRTFKVFHIKTKSVKSITQIIQCAIVYWPIKKSISDWLPFKFSCQKQERFLIFFLKQKNRLGITKKYFFLLCMIQDRLPITSTSNCLCLYVFSNGCIRCAEKRSNTP